jgi:hypothetical protein
MEQQAVDLRKEQQASRARPRYPYSAVARFFFRTMDMLAGPETTLAKARLVEALAPIPYRAWENHQHRRMALRYKDRELVGQGKATVRWAREAQDNEYLHLLIVDAKLREEAAEDPRYMTRPIPFLMLGSYGFLMWTMARLNVRRSFLLNAEFEDHSEHYYAQLVDEHPEWEGQAVGDRLVQQYGPFASWAEVFRRVGLDERDHMNASFVHAGRAEHVVRYEGMPETQAGESFAA